MKIARSASVKSALVLLLVASLVLTAPTRLSASAQNQIDSAVALSLAWVNKIDAGLYDDSYQFSCDAMREKVPQDRWDLVLKTIRTTWGKVVSRKQTSHVYKPNGVDGLEGECMVITYDTSFSKLDSAREEVVLRWQDGNWRGAGYHAGPKPAPEDNTATPPAAAAPTETHTDPHVAPLPQ